MLLLAMGNDCYEFDILYTAIYFDKEDVLKYALTRYKDINDRVYSDEYGLTLLTYACKLSNVKLAHILLEHGINVNGCQSLCDTYKVYPIMEAIAIGSSFAASNCLMVSISLLRQATPNG